MAGKNCRGTHRARSLSDAGASPASDLTRGVIFHLLLPVAEITLPSCCPQPTGITLAAAKAPLMPGTMIAVVAGVGFPHYQLDERVPPQRFRESPGFGLIDPH